MPSHSSQGKLRAQSVLHAWDAFVNFLLYFREGQLLPLIQQKMCTYTHTHMHTCRHRVMLRFSSIADRLKATTDSTTEERQSHSGGLALWYGKLKADTQRQSR